MLWGAEETILYCFVVERYNVITNNKLITLLDVLIIFEL